MGLIRVLKEGFFHWWNELKNNGFKRGFWAIPQSAIAYPVIHWWLGAEEMRNEMVIAVAVLCGTIGAELLKLGWSIVCSPLRIIKEQDRIITGYEKVSSKKAIIHQLTQQFISGTVLRNKGQGLIHESRIDPWWEEFIEWKRETKAIISILDENVADRWWTLGTYTNKRLFPKALTQEQRKKLQMFDAWLERLDKLTKDFKN